MRQPRIRACPYCGSTDVFPSIIFGGPLAGINSKDDIHHCRSCGKDSVPLDFATFDELFEFQRSMRSAEEEVTEGFLHIPIMPVDTEPLFTIGSAELRVDSMAEITQVEWDGEGLVSADPRSRFLDYYGAVRSPRYNASEVLLMDLAAIRSGRPNFKVLQELTRRRRGIWLDMGMGDIQDLFDAFTLGVDTVMADSMTLPSIGLLEEAFELSDSVVPMLMVAEGEVLWGCDVPRDVLASLDLVFDIGFDRVAVVSVGRIGTDLGPDMAMVEGREAGCIIGGGVRESDLDAIREAGFAGALVDPFTEVMGSILDQGALGTGSSDAVSVARGSSSRSPSPGPRPSI